MVLRKRYEAPTWSTFGDPTWLTGWGTTLTPWVSHRSRSQIQVADNDVSFTYSKYLLHLFSTILQNFFVVNLLMHDVPSLPVSHLSSLLSILGRFSLTSCINIFLALSALSFSVCFQLLSVTRILKMLMMTMISFTVFHADLIYWHSQYFASFSSDVSLTETERRLLLVMDDEVTRNKRGGGTCPP